MKYSRAEWLANYASFAHAICFGGEKYLDEPFDFAIMCVDNRQDKPAGYATCIETPDHLYLKHGGGFPSVTNSALAYPTYIAMISWLKERYENIHTKVQNFNVPYLKMAISAGLLPIGVKTHDKDFHVELAMRKDGSHYAI